jgi:DNA-binding FrmR family transcriptional regulator
MGHTTKDKAKLMVRVRRIKGQVNAIESALESSEECEKLLQQVASCRGALNGLMAELIDGHIHHHVLSPEDQVPSPTQLEGAEEVMAVVRRYLS